ncbi:MAG TPA: TonB-dependent receptor plug domain-containing protein, partial [Elusimicrobiota bacterium]|nr:TonB-dependent receptor plug domain-containing protein [Elusimicrobiota bacterium]
MGKFRPYFSIAAGLGLGLLANAARGDGPVAQYAGALGLEPITVLAERYPRMKADLAGTRDVLTRRDIEESRQPEIATLLQQRLFVTVQKPGIGALSGLGIRGISGGRNNNKTRVLVDGVPTDTLRRGFTLETIDPQTVEQLDLIRGPASALYGGGALNGTLNVMTRVPDRREFAAGAAGGSYDTKTSRLYYQDKVGRVAWRVNANSLDTNGHVQVNGDKMINPAWLTNQGTFLEYAG